MTTPQQVPLSVGQEAMWLTWRLDPQQWIHIIPTPYAVHGDLDMARLRSAVDAVGQAYPQLRGRILRTDGGSPVLDWSDAPQIPVRERETTLQRDEAVRRIWQTPFDLEHGPLARVDVVRGLDWTVLLIAVHHIVHDGASVLLTIQALARAYSGEPLAPRSDTEALIAFAERSRRLADSPAGDAHRTYWRDVLTPTNDLFILPATVDEPQYVAHSGQVPPSLVGVLREQAHSLGASYVSVMLAAYSALLRRHTGSDDIVVLVPFHGRTLEAVTDAVGYFVNTLPIRITMAASDSYADLISRVRARVKAAVEHGDLPLPTLLRAAGLTGPAAQARSMQTVFQYWHAGLRHGVDVQRMELAAGSSSARLSLLDMESSAGFPLAVMVREDSAGTHVLWKDPTGAVGPARVSAMAAEFLEVLADIAADPGQALIEVTAGPVPGPSGDEPALIPPAPATADDGRVHEMVRVWQDILGVEDITPEDSFFELGGHSLLAEALVLAVSARFDVDVTIRTLFDHPFLDEFTQHALGPVATADPVTRQAPASSFQHGMWLAELMAPDEALYNVPMAWRIEGGGLDADALRLALADLVTRHEILRTAFRQRDSVLWQIVGEPWSPDLRRVNLGMAGPEELDDWLFTASHEHFAIESGRLLRAALLDIGTDQVLFLCVHHLVWDAASLEVFVRDLDAAYTSRRGEAPQAVAEEPLELPVWRPVMPYAGTGEISFTVSDSDTMAAVVRDLGSSPGDVLLAAFAALLGWYTGRQDVAVTVNESVVRLRPAADRAFTDLLNDIHAGVPASASAAPAGVAFFHGDDAPAIPGAAVLQLNMRPVSGRYEGRLVFDAGRFDHDQMAAMTEHYVRMVAALTAAPERLLSAAEPLTDVERHTQTVVWNDTAARYPDAAVTDLIRQRMLARPGAVALTADAGHITYRELFERAERQARGLINAGVRPGDLVALLLPRGGEQVVSVLAVLLAGAAYLPIDPAYPARRVRLIIDDAGVRWVLAPDANRPHGGLHGFTGTILPTTVAAEPDTAVLPAVALNSPAYCIYTSGTTGRPKGVVINHRNLVRLLRNERFPFSFSDLDVWTMFHAYTFDVSVWEMFACLSYGGRLVVVTEEEANDPWMLWELLQREGVTVTCQTPSAFSRLLALEAPEGGLSRLRHVILAGEALRPAVLRQWTQRFPHVRLVNMYGPTEATVYASMHTIAQTDVQTDASIIGTPLPTTTLLVLDRHTGSRLLPVGAIGELYIGGAGVADGYLNRPELTAERFVASPLDGQTLYRTGDLVRYRPDGALEFLGRADSQVKIRGYRVELGEVEASLRTHPHVTDAVVRVDDDQLVAIVQTSTVLTAAELRHHVAEQLPAYLVPSTYQKVERIPLTSHGKLDIAALRTTAIPLPASAASPLEAAHRGVAVTGTERVLASLWSQVLDADEVSADDSFFALGGHSLLAFRLLRLIERGFGTRLSMRQLFENPRLRDLAGLLDRHGIAASADNADERALVTGVGRSVSAFQERLLLAEGADERTAHNVFLAWTTSGHIDHATLSQALIDLVVGHEILRTGFVADADGMRQVTHAPWAPQLERLDLSAEPDSTGSLTAWLDEATGRRFDLPQGKLMRVALADLGARGQALLLCLHHLVIDDGAIPMLLSELQRYYLAGQDGRPAGPPARQYHDVIGNATGDFTDLAHWRSHLSDAPVYLDLPPVPAPERDGTVRVVVPEPLAQRLRQIQQDHHVSAFMLFGTALSAALHRWTGQPSLTLGVPVTRRARAGAQDVLGPCLNTVVLRSRYAQGDTAAHHLAAFRTELLNALEHADTAFEEVLRDMAPERRFGRTPYVDVLLNMNLRDERRAMLGDATLEPFFAESVWARTSTFPLTLTVAEQDGQVTAVLAYRGTQVTGDGAADLADHITCALAELADAPGSVTHAAGSVQYLDVAAAEAQARQRPGYQELLRYWEQQLAGTPVNPQLPEPGDSDPNGAVEVPLPGGLAKSLRRFQAEHDLSPYMVAATATMLALHHWTGRPDLALTSEMTTRKEAAHADVIGPLLNTVVLRNRIGSGDTVLGLLRAVRSTVIDAMAHSGAAFADVVTRLAPPRQPGRTPWGEVALEFETVPDHPHTLDGRTLHPVQMSREDAGYVGKTALTVSFVLSDDDLFARIAHRGDQVDRADAARFATMLGHLMTNLPSLLDRTVSSLDVADTARLERNPA